MRLLGLFMISLCLCVCGNAGAAPHPGSLPKELAAYVASLPSTARSLDELVARFTEPGDLVELSSTAADGSHVLWTTTVEKLPRANSKTEDGGASPPSNPEIGDEITFSQTRTFGNQVWRITWTMTWMFNPETGRNEWIQTSSTTKFIRFITTIPH